MLFNFGHTTTHVANAFATEHQFLRELPPHPNVVRLLHDFVSVPSAAMMALLEDKVKANLMVPNRRTGKPALLKTQFVAVQLHSMTLGAYLEVRLAHPRTARLLAPGCLPPSPLRRRALGAGGDPSPARPPRPCGR